MITGVVKFVPVPILTPPVLPEYQFIVPADDVADKVTVPLPHLLPAVVPVIVGIGLTVTVTIVLEELEQPDGLSASAKYEVVTDGVTRKSAPLALVPRDVPPVPVKYHLIELPAEVAFRFEDPPVQTEPGVEVTEVGAAGVAFTVASTDVLVSLVHPFTVAST